MVTETDVKRMAIREFRASLKADMSLPVIVTSDGQDAFAVVGADVLRGLLERAKAHEAKCPFCGITAEPKPVPGEGIQVHCSACRRPFRWVMS